MIKIRAHHLLCLQAFRGSGYDEKFIENISDIVNSIKDSSKTEVMLISGVDDVCKACPHKKEGVCLKKDIETNNETLKREEKMLKDLGIKRNTIYNIHGLYDIINTKIKTKVEASEIFCFDCSWNNMCAWFNSKD